MVDLNAAFRAGDRVTLFAIVNNVFDKRYYTYGSFGPVSDVPWPNIPGGVTDPRTASPGTPDHRLWRRAADLLGNFDAEIEGAAVREAPTRP